MQLSDRERQIADLYRARYQSFVHVAWGITRDEQAAVDAVQEGFARALTRLNGYRGEGTLEAWVWPIVLTQLETSPGRNGASRLSGSPISRMTVLSLRSGDSTPRSKLPWLGFPSGSGWRCSCGTTPTLTTKSSHKSWESRSEP